MRGICKKGNLLAEDTLKKGIKYIEHTEQIWLNKSYQNEKKFKQAMLIKQSQKWIYLYNFEEKLERDK
jgi:hypothetical protein